MSLVFGIDFGTTNSALSVFRNGQVEVVPLDVDSNGKISRILRSVLYFNESSEVFCGSDAINHYIDDGASGRFMQSIKTFLPNTSFVSTEVFGRRYTIEDLVAILLKEIKKRGESYVKAQVDSVVLGRPVVFSDDPVKDSVAEARLESAARKAGFKNIWFQYEPVAAALAFEETLTDREEKIVLIGDFGGGTSDFSVMRLQGGDFARSNRLDDVLALGGIYVAGDKFDSQIMWDKVAKYFGRFAKYKVIGKNDWVKMPKSLIYTLSQWHRIPLLRARKTRELIRMIKNTTDDVVAIKNLENIVEDNYGFFLFLAIEKAKCELSLSQSAVIRFIERDLNIDEPVLKQEFETLNMENLSQISKCLDDVMAASGISNDKIDSVFLTGGTSRIPIIHKMFLDRFSQQKIVMQNNLTSVVHGLGYSVPLYI